MLNCHQALHQNSRRSTGTSPDIAISVPNPPADRGRPSLGRSALKPARRSRSTAPPCSRIAGTQERLDARRGGRPRLPRRSRVSGSFRIRAASSPRVTEGGSDHGSMPASAQQGEINEALPLAQGQGGLSGRPPADLKGMTPTIRYAERRARSGWRSRAVDMRSSGRFSRPRVDLDDDYQMSILLCLYIAVAERQGVPSDKPRGPCERHPEGIHRLRYLRVPPTPSMRRITDTFAFCRERVPRWNTIRLGLSRPRGGTAAQEVAFTLPTASRTSPPPDAGQDVDDFAPRLAFFNAHNNLLEEVAVPGGLPDARASARALRARTRAPRCFASMPRPWGARHRPAAGEQHRPRRRQASPRSRRPPVTTPTRWTRLLAAQRGGCASCRAPSRCSPTSRGR